MNPKTYFQPNRKGHPEELPYELFSFQAFPDYETCVDWLFINDYDPDDFDIVEYHDDEIEEVTIIDEYSYIMSCHEYDF